MSQVCVATMNPRTSASPASAPSSAAAAASSVSGISIWRRKRNQCSPSTQSPWRQTFNASSIRLRPASSTTPMPLVLQGSSCTAMPYLAMDTVLHRIDQFLKRERFACSLGGNGKFGRHRISTPGALTQQYACLIEALGHQEIEWHPTVRGLEERRSRAACVAPVALPKPNRWAITSKIPSPLSYAATARLLRSRVVVQA